MDSNYFASGGVGASIVVVIGLIYGMINHKRSRCNLCGRKIEVSIDVDNTGETTPKRTPLNNNIDGSSISSKV